MQGFIVRYYRLLSIVLTAILLILAFLLGLEEGRREKSNSIVLSCTDEVLSSLKVPLTEIASGGNTKESTASEEVFLGNPEVDGVTTTTVPMGMYVGSKNGTKYYLPKCGTVKRIKPENYVWFKNADDAKMQGYSEGSC